MDKSQEFRSSLEDVVVIVSKLGAVCQSISDLVRVCELAVQDDSQLRFLMGIVKSK